MQIGESERRGAVATTIRRANHREKIRIRRSRNFLSIARKPTLGRRGRMEERDHARGAPLNISHGVVDVGLVRHVSVRRRFWDNRTGRKRLRSADRFVSRRGYLLIKSILQSNDVLNSVRMTCIGFTCKTLSKGRSSSITTKLRLGSQSRSIGYLRLKGKGSLISGIGTRINLSS